MIANLSNVLRSSRRSLGQRFTSSHTKILLTGHDKKELKAVHKELSLIDPALKLVKLPMKTKRFTVLRSPHVNKTAREQFEMFTHKWALFTDVHQTTVERYLENQKTCRQNPGVLIEYNDDTKEMYKRLKNRTAGTEGVAAAGDTMQPEKTNDSPLEPRKAGVASDDEMQTFVDKFKDSAIVVDARNKDFSVEVGDEKHSSNIAGNPPLIHEDDYYSKHSPVDRPRAINLPYNRDTQSLNLDSFVFFDGTSMLEQGKDTPIITHCGGGGRGQKAKDFLEANGFTNVINGGGPSVKEHWELFGSL